MSIFGGHRHFTPIDDNMKVEYINSTEQILKDIEVLSDYLLRFDAVLYEDTKTTINKEIATLSQMVTMAHGNPKMIIKKPQGL